MEASIHLGRFRGIPIGIHYSWFIVFGLLTYSLAEGVFPEFFEDWSLAAYWITGASASLLLFASVLAHELGHAITAQRRGIPVRSITLFIFGGVAAIGDETETPRDEFVIAAMGPVVSAATAVASITLLIVIGSFSEHLAAIFWYVGFANILLVVFNLIPGFPLDGGRIFRAILWWITGSMNTATRIASRAGVLTGYGFIVLGIFLVFQEALTGIWFIAIGWFLQTAADQAYQQLRTLSVIEGIPVERLMEPNPVVAPSNITLEDLVHHYLLGQNVRGVPVVDEAGRMAGIITLSDIKDVPPEEWPRTTVQSKMTRRDDLVTASPDTELAEIVKLMSERDIHQVPVVADGELVGTLTRGAVIRFLQLSRELPLAVTEGVKVPGTEPKVEPVR